MFRTSFITAKKLFDWNIELSLGLKSIDVKKRDLVLEEGQRCDYLFFVLKGCLRMYYLDLQGNQVTHWFTAENSIVTSPFSFFKQEKNILSIEALEDTELILITATQLRTIIKEVRNADSEIRNLYTEFAMNFSRRIMDIHTKTAEERYLKFIEEYPDLIKRVKLSHIASYLGVTQQSLSRIRKNI